MVKRNKILIPLIIVILIFVAGAFSYQYWWVPKEQEKKIEKFLSKAYSCIQNSDCEIADFSCCPEPSPCGSKNLDSVNKNYKSQLETYLKSKCKENCLPPAPPACTECLKLEKTEPVCTNNQCSIKKELNCEDYCKAIVKNKTKTCPFISNETLITKENTEKCKCNQKTITLTTDEKEYKIYELSGTEEPTIKITLRNNSDETIFYSNFDGFRCKSSFNILAEEGESYPLGIFSCRPQIIELKPRSEISYNFYLTNTFDLSYWGDSNSIQIQYPLTYKLEFNYGFNEDGIENNKIYSNQFIIRKKIVTDLKECENIKDEYKKAYCFREVAVNKKEPTICNLITSQINEYLEYLEDECYIAVAKFKKDETICENEKMQPTTYSSGIYRDICYDNLAKIKRNPSLCDEIGNAIALGKENCYIDMAIIMDNSNFCKKVLDKTYRNWCLKEIQQRNLTPEEVTAGFFYWYINEGGNPERLKERVDITNEYKQKIARITSKGGLMADPVIFAQAEPEDRVSIGKAIITGSTASLVTSEFEGSHHLRVTLLLVDNRWKINDIQKIK